VTESDQEHMAMQEAGAERLGGLESEEIPVRKYSIDLCDACIDGLGQECHTPGCALWIHNSPGIPIHVASYGMCRLLDNNGHAPKTPRAGGRKG
jgi:hypothetical protein